VALRILIVGAGPTGLTAAVELARHGIIAEVIDSKDKASTLSRAVGILPKSLKLLAAAGVSEKLAKEGIKIHQAIGYETNKKILTLPIHNTQSKYNYLLALAQDRTENTLLNTFNTYGGNVLYSTKLTSLNETDEHVVAQINHTSESIYDLIIGADGIHSSTRKYANIDYPGLDLPETWSIADVNAYHWPHPTSFTMSLLNHGQVVVIVPLESNRFRIISNTDNSLETLPLDLNINEINRQGQFKISVRQANQYNTKRIFLAGDSAHCHSPVGGRGMNLGIADACELVQRIIGRSLEEYSTSRHKEGEAIINMSERARKVVTSENKITRALTVASLKTINRSSYLQQRMSKIILGLK